MISSNFIHLFESFLSMDFTPNAEVQLRNETKLITNTVTKDSLLLLTTICHF